MLESPVVVAHKRKTDLNVLIATQTEFLSFSEQERARTLAPEFLHDFLSGRQILYECIFDSCGLSLTDYTVEYVGNTPVIIAGEVSLFCSISHSKQFVACAVHPTIHMGIDIEEFVPRVAEFEVYITTPSEIALFQNEFSLKTLSTIVWSIKEAAFKADQKQRNVTDYCILSYSSSRVVVSNKLTSTVFVVMLTVTAETTLAYVIS